MESWARHFGRRRYFDCKTVITLKVNYPFLNKQIWSPIQCLVGNDFLNRLTSDRG